MWPERSKFAGILMIQVNLTVPLFLGINLNEYSDLRQQKSLLFSPLSIILKLSYIVSNMDIKCRAVLVTDTFE